MGESYSTQRLLELRKFTRAIVDLLRRQMREYLSTLAPLFRPRNVLGDYAEGGAYEASRIGEKAFKELQELYQTIAQSKLYRLPSEFKTPVEVINTQLEMTPGRVHTHCHQRQREQNRHCYFSTQMDADVWRLRTRPFPRNPRQRQPND